MYKLHSVERVDGMIFKEVVTISFKALFQTFNWRKSAKTLHQGGCIRTQDHQRMYDQHMYEKMCGNIQAYTTHCVQTEHQVICLIIQHQLVLG